MHMAPKQQRVIVVHELTFEWMTKIRFCHFAEHTLGYPRNVISRVWTFIAENVPDDHRRINSLGDLEIAVPVDYVELPAETQYVV